MHIGPWIVEVTGAWRFDWSWEPEINWLLHNWLGCAIFWLIERPVLTRLCWLFTCCGNCRGAAITFDSEATWFVWKRGAAGFKTVFWCGCSMSCMVIDGTLVECTPVIGLIHWLDCRQSFSKNILSVLLGRCGVLFATVGKQGSFCRSEFNSWLSGYPFVPMWTWEGTKFCCRLGKLWYWGFLLANESWLFLCFGKFNLKVSSNAEFWANRPSACNWIVGSAKLKGFGSEWLLERFKFWIGGKRFCDVLKLSLKLIWAVSIRWPVYLPEWRQIQVSLILLEMWIPGWYLCQSREKDWEHLFCFQIYFSILEDFHELPF